MKNQPRIYPAGTMSQRIQIFSFGFRTIRVIRGKGMPAALERETAVVTLEKDP